MSTVGVSSGERAGHVTPASAPFGQHVLGKAAQGAPASPAGFNPHVHGLSSFRRGGARRGGLPPPKKPVETQEANSEELIQQGGAEEGQGNLCPPFAQSKLPPAV